MTANSFASVSLEPPLVSVCVDHRARLLPMLKEKQRFGVNVLKQGQRAHSEYFAGIEQDPEALERLGVKFFWTDQKIPLLENVLCQLSCKLSGLHVAGDHTIVIAEVESANSLTASRCFFIAASITAFPKSRNPFPGHIQKFSLGAKAHYAWPFTSRLKP